MSPPMEAPTAASDFVSANWHGDIPGWHYAGRPWRLQNEPRSGSEDGSAHFFLEIMSSPTNATLITTQATATIANTPTISIGNVSQNEGNSGTSNMQFVVTLSNPSVNEITVDYFTQDGTASGGVDYTAESGGVDFAPGETTADINVPIIGNTEYEPNKTFTVNLTSPTNGTLGTSSATGTIVNDDALPTIQISPASVAEGNSGTTTMTFDVHPLQFQLPNHHRRLLHQ